jgi:hypothetical protein
MLVEVFGWSAQLSCGAAGAAGAPWAVVVTSPRGPCACCPSMRPSVSLGMLLKTPPPPRLLLQVLGGAFITGYPPPDGFCYDVQCADPPVQDDPALEDYNVPFLVDLFVERCGRARGAARCLAPCPLPPTLLLAEVRGCASLCHGLAARLLVCTA